MKSDEYELVQVPPAYSDADKETIRLINEHLAELQRRYREEVEPLVNMLAQINSRYLPRIFLVPKGKPKTA